MKTQPYMQSWFVDDDHGHPRAYIYCYAAGCGKSKAGRYYVTPMGSADVIKPKGHATLAAATKAAERYLAAEAVQA